MAYIGIDNKARKIKNIYIGVDGVARKVTKAYVGVNGVARLWWDASTGGDPVDPDIPVDPGTGDYPMLAESHSWYKSSYDKATITTITMVNTYTPTGNEDETWFADINQTGAIKCYRIGTKIIIAGNGSGRIYANRHCGYVFANCTSLTSLDVSILDTSQVENMNDMFYNCKALTSLDLRSFDTRKVTYMAYMFYGCSKLGMILATRGLWVEPSSQSSKQAMFGGTSAIIKGVSLVDSTHNDNYPIFARNGDWYKSSYAKNKITSITFLDTYTPTGSENAHWAADLGGTGAITCYRIGTELIIAGNGSGGFYAHPDSSSTFQGFNSIPSITNFALFNTSLIVEAGDHSVTSSNVGGIMYGMFYSCISLTALDLSNFDTRNIIDMSGMFNGCLSLTSLDLSGFNTSRVRNMKSMFDNSGLQTLDLHNFDTSNVEDMSEMFASCNNLLTLDLSNFNTSKVTTMHKMFSGCLSLTSLDLSSFDTSAVKDMSYMFTNCSQLETLDLRAFDTKNVKTMDYMFWSTENLAQVLVSRDLWDTSQATTTSMFSGSKIYSVTYA